MAVAQQAKQHTHSRDGVLYEDDRLPLAGQRIAEAKAPLRDAWNIPYFAEALVNGRPVLVGHVLRTGDHMEFRKRYGINAGADHPAEAVQADGLIAAYPELGRIAGEVAALGLPVADALRVMAVRVGRWLRERFGPPDAQAGEVFVLLMPRP